MFAKYCTPPVEMHKESPADILTPSPGAYLSPEGLDRWATDTNGEIFSEETKEEILEFFDSTDNGDLTYVTVLYMSNAKARTDVGQRHSLKGFLQLYQLQTSNDEKETWKDLVRFNIPETHDG